MNVLFWIIGWVSAFTTAVTLTKFLSSEISSWTIVLMRSLFGLLYISPFLFQRNTSPLKTNYPGLQLLRAVLGSCALACTYYAYQNLPLSIATSIGLSSPLIVTVLSALALNERVPRLRWIAIIAGYAGVLCIVRPTLHGVQWAMGAALLANLFAASAMVVTKKISKVESTQSLLLYSGLAIFALSSSVNLFCWQSFGWTDGMLLALIGGMGVFSQYCGISALRLAMPSFIAPFEYFRLLLALAIDFFIFNEVPTYMTLAGSFIIIASSYAIVAQRGNIQYKKT